MKKKQKQFNNDISLAQVLYQKLGNDWYAFTEVDGDCFMTKVDPNVVDSKKELTKATDLFPVKNKRGRAA